MKINIDNLSREIAADVDLPTGKTKEVVRAIFDVLAENMSEGHEVNIPDFGKFRRKDRPARQARNPATGAMVDVPAKSVPNFLVAKRLKERVNG